MPLKVCIFAILLLGILWKGATQWGGLAGFLVGILSSFLMYQFEESIFTIQNPFLYVSWWSFVVGFITAVLVSLITKPYPKERIIGLVYGLDKK